MLLEKTYGESAAEKYNEFTDYQKAVFVNTVVAAAHVKANFSAAKFKDFYRADYGYENGIYVDGLKGKTRGRHEKEGSVEFEREKRGKHRGKVHIDVDLYKGGLFGGKFSEHLGEWWFNKKHKRGTHPGDVEKRFAEEAGINTGVSCKRK